MVLGREERGGVRDGRGGGVPREGRGDGVWECLHAWINVPH